ncbi:hypothetical protein [Capnocytophaga canis]|uniref:Uncharacterized protein n=1 Tax=Capnocytophaga canis TaxID=1848903 RepID=A0A0B7IR74_9FLAO|nr:hypothetical protein [Capnocytophaga canis]CEN54406.1 hypothetical protein CCAND93_880003 [Capnocytophaga canis]
METQEKIIKKISFENFIIIKKLNELSIDLSDNEKKKISQIIKMIQANDKHLLKSFSVKFSDKEKNNILEAMEYFTT